MRKPKIRKTELLALTVHKILGRVPKFDTEAELQAWLEEFKKRPAYVKEALGREAYEEAKNDIENSTFLY